MKLSDRFEIDDDELEARADESDYWQNAWHFWNKKKDLDDKFLSEKEAFWLEKIERDLDDGK